ncbi:MAG: hypothetical protein K2M78_18110 [Lachnospiraceae bacterium]|nr:hypothetical protein [Lachnospiraceae bacterium]
MLEEKDLEVLKSIMKTVASEESILDKIDEKITKSQNILIDEMERTRNILEKKMDKVQNNLDELSKRVEELEKRTA